MRPEPTGRLYADCWHPESPGARITVRPGMLRRLGIVRSPFATLRETIRWHREFEAARRTTTEQPDDRSER